MEEDISRMENPSVELGPKNNLSNTRMIVNRAHDNLPEVTGIANCKVASSCIDFGALFPIGGDWVYETAHLNITKATNTRPFKTHDGPWERAKRKRGAREEWSGYWGAEHSIASILHLYTREAALKNDDHDHSTKE